MSGKHAQQPTPAELFDAQYAHSKRMAEAHRNRPLQERVDEYIEARRQDHKEKIEYAAMDQHGGLRRRSGSVLGDRRGDQ